MTARRSSSNNTPSKPVCFVDLKKAYAELKKEIDDAISGVLGSCGFVLGKEVAQFEEEFASYCDRKHCIGVGSGLDALTLSFKAIGLSLGDEVILPANTFVATALAVMQTGATPVLVEYDPYTYNIDPRLIGGAITEKTKAIVPVHLYGQSADMDAINAIAAEHGLEVIEDAAQAHGATYKDRRCGSMSRAACFSFYPGKNLGAMGDGGAILTDDDKLARELRMMRNYGSSVKYQHDINGTNSRLDTIQAAVLRVKLQHLDRWNDLRSTAAARYSELLSDLPIGLPKTASYARHIFHLYVIQSDRRDGLLDALQKNNIQAGFHYPVPIHQQPACRDVCKIPAPLTQTAQAAERLLSLPMHPHLSEADIEHVANTVRTYVESQSSKKPVAASALSAGWNLPSQTPTEVVTAEKYPLLSAFLR